MTKKYTEVVELGLFYAPGATMPACDLSDQIQTVDFIDHHLLLSTRIRPRQHASMLPGVQARGPTLVEISYALPVRNLNLN